jgi:hypothetical protein
MGHFVVPSNDQMKNSVKMAKKMNVILYKVKVMYHICLGLEENK